MNKSTPAKLSVGFIATIYTIFGIMFFIAPEKYASNLGFIEPTNTALLEITAVYGGFEFISGLAIFVSIISGRAKLGAYYSLVSLGGFTFGRIIGIAKYGLIGNNLQFLILELTLTVLSYFSFRRLENEK